MSELHKFLFDGLPVRGMLVRLTGAWREVLARREPGHEYPPELRDLLGEMSAAAVLMQANIKFNGALVLQVFGDGPVKLAVAEAQHDLTFRTTAKCVGDIPPGATLEGMLNLHGHGRCAITLDPRDKLPGQQPYQGVVPLHGDRREPLQKMSEVLEHYMLQSEQLDTRLVLAANGDFAAGLLIQRLPVEGEGNLEGKKNEDDIGLSDAFNRISMLASTLTSEELLTLDADTILRRLFWEETVTRFEPLAPRFACTCSRERVAQMLRGLGREEADSVLAERGDIEIGCDFCGRHYRFDAVDVGMLFTTGNDQPSGASATLQ
ncbi:Hsp33 family molecular chaperone HslO [Roseateles saccharophilus]|uniref:Molecular chaperone Hsp33 n=1 Tax=Roseateles saccharophilus TaxID=304 RepID=A0A4R3VF43_ROSSA|nr:Hsp33 family molecular chaperone HslO [Roseateles saccharophilus]MDG0832263.1 Hsp33 family molecular chaperone HslO [Roseateles saccharophilus]TCV02362.1 molecular chaperone Hsp33 [Roseateles saccharophilus]